MYKFLFSVLVAICVVAPLCPVEGVVLKDGKYFQIVLPQKKDIVYWSFQIEDKGEEEVDKEEKLKELYLFLSSAGLFFELSNHDYIIQKFKKTSPNGSVKAFYRFRHVKSNLDSCETLETLILKQEKFLFKMEVWIYPINQESVEYLRDFFSCVETKFEFSQYKIRQLKQNCIDDDPFHKWVYADRHVRLALLKRRNHSFKKGGSFGVFPVHWHLASFQGIDFETFKKIMLVHEALDRNFETSTSRLSFLVLKHRAVGVFYEPNESPHFGRLIKFAHRAIVNCEVLYKEEYDNFVEEFSEKLNDPDGRFMEVMKEG